MTRDAAAQAVHERLEHAAASSPAFDVEAGWAALSAQLEGPIAPVIPLRRRRPRRTVALAVAAAVFIGGSALAMVRHSGAPGLSIAPIATLPASGPVTGPHVHPAFSGAPPVDGAPAGPDGTSGGGAGGGSPSDPSGSGSTGGSSQEGSGGGSGGSGGPNQDSPDDIDHGGGNDGQHDDNGGGNDANGSSQGGGGNGDPGSGGGQGGSHGNGH
jgi:hypothetical protein